MSKRDFKFRLWAEAESDGEKKMLMFDNDFIGDWKLEDVIDWQAKSRLMQYTGVKDKNGVEIYEGDILNCYNGVLGEVIYQAPHFIFYNDRLSSEDTNLHDADEEWSAGNFKGVNPHFQVIGNIFEHPKLAKMCLLSEKYRKKIYGTL